MKDDMVRGPSRVRNPNFLQRSGVESSRLYQITPSCTPLRTRVVQPIVEVVLLRSVSTPRPPDSSETNSRGVVEPPYRRRLALRRDTLYLLVVDVLSVVDHFVVEFLVMKEVAVLDDAFVLFHSDGHRAPSLDDGPAGPSRYSDIHYPVENPRVKPTVHGGSPRSRPTSLRGPPRGPRRTKSSSPILIPFATSLRLPGSPRE